MKQTIQIFARVKPTVRKQQQGVRAARVAARRGLPGRGGTAHGALGWDGGLTLVPHTLLRRPGRHADPSAPLSGTRADTQASLVRQEYRPGRGRCAQTPTRAPGHACSRVEDGACVRLCAHPGSAPQHGALIPLFCGAVTPLCTLCTQMRPKVCFSSGQNVSARYASPYTSEMLQIM